ncbi:TetR/AcrR family transcriptional regulator [Candidatus Xianfuyuplasma coldseepsis]|uniref:TetR/AcrR family transcriptional regulator n=1 Tax=Candidatus Xianfuyuplasma coldseepsis TaxID=2782163 RepID=A0A7L7KT56_9MOLU|nr:TetR/AcrR family transcriptional regulator [Xianfuyuplasma coldseepsis]QMS85579.1 TetR/AcrR family transcriptional regulator [Xianfuyuplasma coldseepsis]
MSIVKRQHIIEVAMKLFVEHGFHATPTSQIAKKAKVSVGTLFNYFPTKEDLIEAIYIHIKLHSKATFLELLEVKQNVHDTLQSMWHAIIQWGIENPNEFRYLELFCHSPFKNTYRTEKSLEAYKQFQNEIMKKVIPSTICGDYPEYVLTYIDNSLHATTRYLLEHDVENPNEFINTTFDLVWKGLSFHGNDKEGY